LQQGVAVGQTPDGRAEFFGLRILQQKALSTRTHRGQHQFAVVEGGEQQDRCAITAFAEGSDQAETTQSGHTDITDDDLHRMLWQHRQQRLRITAFERDVDLTGVAQQGGQAAQYEGLIVTQGDANSCAHAGASGSRAQSRSPEGVSACSCSLPSNACRRSWMPVRPLPN